MTKSLSTEESSGPGWVQRLGLSSLKDNTHPTEPFWEKGYMTLLSSLYEASVTLTPKFQCHETILEVMDNCKTMQVQSNIWKSINL